MSELNFGQSLMDARSMADPESKSVLPLANGSGPDLQIGGNDQTTYSWFDKDMLSPQGKQSPQSRYTESNYGGLDPYPKNFGITNNTNTRNGDVSQSSMERLEESILNEFGEV